MNKIKWLICFLIISRTVYAHNPQVSTISIIQNQNKKWDVFITAPLYTCQLAIKASHPTFNTDSLDIYATQNLIIDLIKNNLIINQINNIKLINTKIQLAHETTIYLNIDDTLNINEIDFKAFSKLNDHFTVLKLVPLNKAELSYIFNSSNNFKYTTDKIKSKSYNKYLSLITGNTGFYILFLIILIIFIFLRTRRYVVKNKHKGIL